MATPSFESLPNIPADNDIEGYLFHGQERRVAIGGVERATVTPGNFPGVLDAYWLNRAGETSNRVEIEANQRFLAETPAGKIVTGVLDKLHGEEPSEELQRLTEQAIAEQDPMSRDYYFAAILEMAAQHLPPELTSDFLRDPWSYTA